MSVTFLLFNPRNGQIDFRVAGIQPGETSERFELRQSMTGITQRQRALASHHPSKTINMGNSSVTVHHQLESMRVEEV
jgi:hypothetical protein